MDSEQISLKAGEIFVAIGLPDIWPAESLGLVFETALTDGVLAVFCLPGGKFEASVFRGLVGKPDLLHSIRTPTIRAAPRQPLVLRVRWADSKITAFDLNSESMLSPVDEISIPDTPRERPLPNFEARNEAARNNRYSVGLNLPINPKRKQGGQAYMLSALRGEIDQIEDLLSAIQRGRDAHVPGLASRLRLLVSGKPMGLLQHCAAFTKAPLIFYTNANPEELPPIEGGIAILGSGDAQKSRASPCAVDLDVWLKFPALRVGGRVYSHLDAIKEVGDTLGSHRDPGIPQSIQALQVMRTVNGTVYRDVQRYVIEVAEIILALCRSLLSP